MRKGFHDLRLLRWEICQSPHDTIDSAAQYQNNKQEPKAVRQAQISKSRGSLSQMPVNDYLIKSLGA